MSSLDPPTSSTGIQLSGLLEQLEFDLQSLGLDSWEPETVNDANINNTDQWCMHVGLRRRMLSKVPSQLNGLLHGAWKVIPILSKMADAPTPDHYEVIIWLSRANTTPSNESQRGQPLYFEGLSLGFMATDEDAASSITNPSSEHKSQLEVHSFEPSLTSSTDLQFTEYLYLGYGACHTSNVHNSLWINGLKHQLSLVVETVAKQDELVQVLPSYVLNNFCCYSFAELILQKCLQMDAITFAPIRERLRKEKMVWVTSDRFKQFHYGGNYIVPLHEYQLVSTPSSDDVKEISTTYPFNITSAPFVVFNQNTQRQIGYAAFPYSIMSYWENRFPYDFGMFWEDFPGLELEKSSHSVTGHRVEIITSSANPDRHIKALTINNYALQKLMVQLITSFLYGFRECGLKLSADIQSYQRNLWFVIAVYGNDSQNWSFDMIWDHPTEIWRHTVVLGSSPDLKSQIRDFRNMLGIMLLEAGVQQSNNNSRITSESIRHFSRFFSENAQQKLALGPVVHREQNDTKEVEFGLYRFIEQRTIIKADPSDYVYWRLLAKNSYNQAIKSRKYRQDPRLTLCYLKHCLECFIDESPGKSGQFIPLNAEVKASLENDMSKLVQWCRDQLRDQSDAGVPLRNLLVAFTQFKRGHFQSP